MGLIIPYIPCSTNNILIIWVKDLTATLQSFSLKNPISAEIPECYFIYFVYGIPNTKVRKGLHPEEAKTWKMHMKNKSHGEMTEGREN